MGELKKPASSTLNLAEWILGDSRALIIIWNKSVITRHCVRTILKAISKIFQLVSGNQHDPPLHLLNVYRITVNFHLHSSFELLWRDASKLDA
jgi:hypothetical protein